MTTLTLEQQTFAAEHHNLVYRYLNQRHLPENDFYDIVIFGYLKAVQTYLEREELRQYEFSTIAWTRMRSSVIDYYRAQNRPKRKAEILSLDLGAEKVEDRSADVVSKLCAAELYDGFEADVRQMLQMRASGASNGDIARRFKKPVHIVANEIGGLYQSAVELMAA
jgi:DNA-directed RNA polymerase specialized sigma24 family protein